MNRIDLLEITPDERIRIIGAADLMLERIPELVYPEEADAEKRAYAMSVLANPLAKAENVAYRRDIARDFLVSGDLLSRVVEDVKGIDELSALWQEERRQVIAEWQKTRENSGYTDEANFQEKISMVQADLRQFLRLYDRLNKLIDTLTVNTLYADGLLEFKETCIRLYASYAFSAVPRARKLLEVDPARYTCELLLGMNENLAVDTVELNMLYTPDAEESAANSGAPGTELNVTVPQMMPLVRAALDNLDSQTVGSCETLERLFNDLNAQLRFYTFCTDFCHALTAAGANYMFPQMTDADSGVTSALELRDVYEVLSHEGAGNSHDVLLTPERSGIIVTGEGGVGKTALLRAVCTAQILAQCGLPVTCRDASLAIRTGVFACFTESFDASKEPMRRFETEARAMAKIIDNLTPHALVALNELFESTGFADASDALYNIFSVISQHDIYFIATTHLPRLAERFIEIDHVTAMSMKAGGKLVRMRS